MSIALSYTYSFSTLVVDRLSLLRCELDLININVFIQLQLL